MTPVMRPIPWDAQRFVLGVEEGIADWRWALGEQNRMVLRVGELAEVLDALGGDTVQERWTAFEATVWSEWLAGRGRLGGELWRWGTWGAVLTRSAQPAWPLMSTGRIGQWTERLPQGHPVQRASERLRGMLEPLTWLDKPAREYGRWLGLRLLLVHGLESIEQLTDEHLRFTGRAKGMDALDGALCAAGILQRPAMRGATRWGRRRQLTTVEMVDITRVPERFREVTIRYLDEYRVRVAPVYATVHAKAIALGHWWRYVDENHPELTSCAAVRPRHARGFLPWAKERAQAVRRRSAHDDSTHERATAHAWAGAVKVFFADLGSWAADEDSPLAGMAPPCNPLGRRDLVTMEPLKIKRQTQARIAIKVLELERELPSIRAYALRRWQAVSSRTAPPRHAQCTDANEVAAFWDWAILELLLLSGLRVEEACELTTLDVLRRQLPDGRRYYLLHVKPSKYDRARVIPIGDGLGRVISETVRHVRAFHGADAVPAVRAWDSHERRWRPAAPYLLQTASGHPSVIDEGTIRARLARMSRDAGARRADGTPLVLQPHDCRRMFASEHLNNSTPPHVIQALLGHATIDTVLVYAKLYPTTLVEEYRKTLRGVYQARYGDEAFRNPIAEEWAALNQACAMRDMGTHLCALPTGQHCPKGLVCLGCSHAQPKRSAVPVFRGMLASHLRVLEVGRQRGEPAGQIAARELEVERIRAALHRAEALGDDVAAAIETAGSGS
jgi:integrase